MPSVRDLIHLLVEFFFHVVSFIGRFIPVISWDAVIHSNGIVSTDPVNQRYDDEEENEGIRPVTIATALISRTATTGALHYAVAMTTSRNPRHRGDPSVVEIDLLDQGDEQLQYNRL